MRRARLPFLLVGIAGLVLAACGDDDAATGSGEGGAEDQPTVVASTNILGDVLEAVAGEQVDVVTLMPVGADPHTFRASAQEANQLREADALIVNGLGFEEGLVDVIDAATEDGTPTFEAISPVETIELGEGGHAHGEEHADEEAAEDEHAEEEAAEDEHAEGKHAEDEHAEEERAEEERAEEERADHDHEGEDPHFFADPARMAVSVDGMAEFLIESVEGIDADALRASADGYIAELEALDAEVEEILADIPEDQRVLVTDHDALGYFAESYDLEVVGTVIPSGSTADGASAGELAELVEVIEEEGVPAIFVGTTVSDELAQTLAAEVGAEIAVVELFTGSLGEPESGADTYVAMVQTNAERIAEALSA